MVAARKLRDDAKTYEDENKDDFRLMDIEFNKPLTKLTSQTRDA